ncbi:MAG: ornithine cyclodeaminase [Cellvibrio sp.]|jgi:ornithine cyclodeaminase|nr:ornithine cyclodeaminase [Cellvibrio sp.]
MTAQQHSLLILNQQALSQLDIPLPGILDIVQQAFLSLADPDSANPLKVILEPVDKHSIAYSMAGRDAGSRSVGFKVVYEYDSDRSRNRYQFYSFIFILDDATGQPLALMDVQQLGPLRTSATSALIAKMSARKGATTALVVGTGAQGQIALPMLVTAIPSLEKLIMHGSYEAGINSAQENLRRYYPERHIVRSTNLQQSVAEADIIIAVTGRSARESIPHHWLKPGALIILVGYGVEPEVLHKADYIVATDEQQMKVTSADMVDGNGNIPAVNAELAQILNGEKPGRSNDAQIVFAYNSGMIITDVALGRITAEHARRAGVGQEVQLW